MSGDLENMENDVAAQQAAHWLMRLSEGNPDDRAPFLQWLKRSPRHIEEFLLMSTVCRGLSKAEPPAMAQIERLIAESTDKPSNVVSLPGGEAARGEDPLAVSRDRDAGAPRTSGPHAVRWVGLAACAALIGLVAIWSLPRVARSPSAYITAVGEQRTVRLPDGSVVYMNAQSRLSVKYSETARDIELLGGEAIFQVEHSPDRPFRVHTSTATIQALGTRFNVYRRARGNVVVSVLEGAVRVSKSPATAGPASSPDGAAYSSSSSHSTLQLGAGEEAQVAATGAIVKQDHADLSRTTAWRERRLVFREDRLDDIAGEFARYNSQRIVPADEAARAQRITGTFDADDPATLIQFLRKLDELSVETTPQEFIVRSR